MTLALEVIITPIPVHTQAKQTALFNGKAAYYSPNVSNDTMETKSTKRQVRMTLTLSISPTPTPVQTRAKQATKRSGEAT